MAVSTSGETLSCSENNFFERIFKMILNKTEVSSSPCCDPKDGVSAFFLSVSKLVFCNKNLIVWTLSLPTSV